MGLENQQGGHEQDQYPDHDEPTDELPIEVVPKHAWSLLGEYLSAQNCTQVNALS